MFVPEQQLSVEQEEECRKILASNDKSADLKIKELAELYGRSFKKGVVVEVSRIRLDDIMRSINPEHSAKLQAAFRDPTRTAIIMKKTPILGYNENGQCFVFDGCHRVHAATKAGIQKIEIPFLFDQKLSYGEIVDFIAAAESGY